MRQVDHFKYLVWVTKEEGIRICEIKNRKQSQKVIVCRYDRIEIYLNKLKDA